ncbi:DUF3367 domain-containing protein [Candidatus Microgenomates bacterium]|jgi:hypothetical protein|nr:MAG: DUF3367 domain-containing protein [Candidatus Microgenomates bacterium]
MLALFKKNWPLAVILLLGLVPFFWFRPGKIIAGGDNYLSINPSAGYFESFFSWNSKTDAGTPSFQKPLIFPYFTFYYFGQKIGISLEFLQRVWLVFHFTARGIFAYFFIREIYRGKEKGGIVAGLIGAVFYMFNCLIMLDIMTLARTLTFTYLPVMLYLFMKGLEKRKLSLRYCFLIALVSILYSPANANFPVVFPIYLILALYLVYYVIFSRRVKHSLFFALITAVFVLVANLWWVTDFYFSQIQASKQFIAAVKEYDFIERTPISESFRTMGFWAFRTLLGDKPLIPFALPYYKLPLVLLTFMIPFLSFSSLLFRSENKKKYFFALLALTGIFLAKGANPPFGFIYNFLYDKVPLFSSFREPFAKFTLIHVFSFSVLLGFFTEDLYNYIAQKEKRYLKYAKVFPAVVILTILIICYPLFLGKSIQDETWYGDSRYSLFVKVPQYWKDLSIWLQRHNKDARILVFPKNFYGMTYNWESGASFAGPAAIPLLPNPIIMHPPRVPTSEQNRMAMLIYRSLYLGEKADIFPYLDLFNVGYVLQQNDAAFNNETGVFDPFIMNKLLSDQEYLKQEAGFGHLEFINQDKKSGQREVEALGIFSVRGNNKRRYIYSPQEVIFVSGRLEDYWDIFSFSEYSTGSAYIFSGDQYESINPAQFSASQIFISLKNKLDSKNNENYVYKFSVPVSSFFRLLINNLLVGKSEESGSKDYYFKINGIDLNKSSNKGTWGRSEPLLLAEGQHTFETNLPVEEIKDEYITNPFWIIEEKKQTELLSSEIIPQKINPAKYKVEISRNKGDSILILNESFHPQWKVYYKNQEQKPIHFLANGYANGWILPEELFKGNEKIDLEIRYYPQEVAQKAAVVSVFFVFTAVSYLSIDLLAGLVKKREQ